MTTDGCMYVDNLIAAWGEIHNVSAEDVLTALRKYAERDGGDSRFTLSPTLGGRTLIKVAAKAGPESPPDAAIAFGSSYPRQRYSLPIKDYTTPRRRELAPRREQAVRAPLEVKEKLDMSLSELINDANQRTGYSGSSSSSSRWKHQRDRKVADVAELVNKPRGMGNPLSLDMSLEEVIDSAEPARKENVPLTAEAEERRARLLRKTEQMGLTPGTAHIRRRPMPSKLPTQSPVEVVDLLDDSDSPVPQTAPVAGDDGTDAALAACVAKSLNVSCSKVTAGASSEESRQAGAMTDDKVEPPDPPPGANWEQFADSEDGTLWYYWPGPGGEWWCGPKEGDKPQPYKSEEGS